MNFRAYQLAALRSARQYEDVGFRRMVTALGLAGEAGEVADVVKKEVGHGHPVDVQKIRDEIGDVIWYAAVLANCYSLDLDDIAEYNVSKLRQRYPEGFSVERSIHRAPEADGV